MKIFICCSKHFYHEIEAVKKELEEMGNVITLPNSYDNPFKEEEMKKRGPKQHIEWKSKLLIAQGQKVNENDAILVLNLEKGDKANYIGGATFLEIFKAFEAGKKIFLFNPLPDSIFKDELTAMNPVIINRDLSKIR